MDAHELDVVELTRPVDSWPAGVQGTVVWELPDTVTIEVGEKAARGEDLDDVLVDAPRDAVRLIWRFPRPSE